MLSFNFFDIWWAIARGISSYNSEDIEKIKGQHSDKITEILGYKFDDDVVIKDNLVLI